ncbi:hypothetical protein ACFL6X_04800 [Candidatus Latescibacterota bacterium]
MVWARPTWVSPVDWAGQCRLKYGWQPVGHIYWLDPGEGCSQTAQVLGLDLMRVRAVFISHVHRVPGDRVFVADDGTAIEV